jgi:hypothetical protein
MDHCYGQGSDDGPLLWLSWAFSTGGLGFFNGLTTFPRIGGTRFADYAAKCEAQD